MRETSIKILNRSIKREAILKVYIFIQMLLHLLAFKALSKYEYSIVEYLFIFLALIYSFIVYLVLLLNNKNKRKIYYYCIITMFLSFFLVIDFIYLKSNGSNDNYLYIYIQIMVLFVVLDITLKILTQNINKGIYYNYIVLLLWTIGLLLGFSRNIIYLIIYQIIFSIINAYPTVFLILNYKNVKNYGSHLIPKLLVFSLINIIFLVWVFIINRFSSASHNYDFYIYLNIIEIYLSYLILEALGFWKSIKSKKHVINRNSVIGFIFIIGYFYYWKESLVMSVFSFISFGVILKQCQLLDYYVKLANNKNTSISDKSGLIRNIIEVNILDFKKEEIFKEQVADFLHDEILQDAIYIKKELQDNYKISRNDKILEIADMMINTTRGQISLYKPHINYEISLAENYYNLIQSLKKRFGNDKILLDFICDNRLFLSSPYDLVIYRMIHELVTNIFKHSKGDFSSIELKNEKKTIFLSVTNYGDYLSQKNISNTDSRGIRIIKREIDRFGGTLDINSSIDPDILENKDILDDSIVSIKIKIPIKGEMTYEYFINR